MITQNNYDNGGTSLKTLTCNVGYTQIPFRNLLTGVLLADTPQEFKNLRDACFKSFTYFSHDSSYLVKW